MAAIESPETVGIRPFHEFDEAHGLWPRGERPAALREAAQDFRTRFKEQGQIRAVRTIDLASAGYPTSFATGIVDPPTGVVESWTTGESHAYKITATLVSDSAAQGLSTSATFDWEAQNQ